MSCEIYEKDYLEFYDSDKCIGDLGEKWCKFKWRIYNIQLNPKERFQSPVFTTRLLPKAYWYLEVNLSSPGNLKTFEVSLQRLQSYENVVSVVDVIYKVICPADTQVSRKGTITYEGEPPFGTEISYTASFYKSKKNYLTVECILKPNKSMIRHVVHRNLDKTLPIHLRALLQSGDLSDAVIEVQNQELKAHKSILHARLPKLVEKCVDYSGKDEYVFKIKDLPVSVVKEMLKYAYTGQAYVDLESLSVNKEVLAEYSQSFLQSCVWDDHPFAQTSFNYETDSLSWDLKDVFTSSNIGRQKILLLRLYPNELELFLDVDESVKENKWLVLTFKFLCEKMPKPTVISCNYFLSNKESNETHELGSMEILLRSKVTTEKMKLYSLLELREVVSLLKATNDSSILKTDFKFCYGSSKSNVENLYEGQFDISQCTSCALLSADLEALFRSSCYSNITIESEDGKKFYVHKEILHARWADAHKLNVKEKKRIVIKGSNAQGLRNILLQLYKGTALK